MESIEGGLRSRWVGFLCNSGLTKLLLWKPQLLREPKKETVTRAKNTGDEQKLWAKCGKST